MQCGRGENGRKCTSVQDFIGYIYIYLYIYIYMYIYICIYIYMYGRKCTSVQDRILESLESNETGILKIKFEKL